MNLMVHLELFYIDKDTECISMDLNGIVQRVYITDLRTSMPACLLTQPNVHVQYAGE